MRLHIQKLGDFQHESGGGIGHLSSVLMAATGSPSKTDSGGLLTLEACLTSSRMLLMSQLNPVSEGTFESALADSQGGSTHVQSDKLQYHNFLISHSQWCTAEATIKQ